MVSFSTLLLLAVNFDEYENEGCDGVVFLTLFVGILCIIIIDAVSQCSGDPISDTPVSKENSKILYIILEQV